MTLKSLSTCLLLLITVGLQAQTVLKGKISDAGNGDPLIGANILVKATTDGNIADYDGFFEIKTSSDYPITLIASYLGYVEKEILVEGPGNITITLEENSVTVDVIEVKASRISEENKKSPLTIESLDITAVKETSSSNFYEGLGQLKGVDLTTASLGFQVINTRGFNSTNPVRSLQIIDGVDNQAPGLNFSLGNFLGSSELDILKVDLIQGASSAFYGPNAFNGVISMETKDPFLHQGLGASVKVAERNLLETAVRWAQAFKNKSDEEWIAYKFNLSYLSADDWEADNYDPVYTDNTEGIGRAGYTRAQNPGGFDAVNIYGDEYNTLFDQSSSSLRNNLAGLGQFHRKGYREIDLVDYDTRNLKSNASVFFRLNPSKTIDSPTLILASSYSNGTTVYQGDNRFSLKNIQFYQNRIEFSKRDKYFVRAYVTVDNAGDTYDPYFTALQLQQAAIPDLEWRTRYINSWIGENRKQDMIDGGYPEFMLKDENGVIIQNPDGSVGKFDTDAAINWLKDPDNISTLAGYHATAAGEANAQTEEFFGFYEPGTPEFQEQFDRITSSPSGQNGGGTRLIDRSKLFHLNGEYKFEPTFVDYIKVGASYRLYDPESEGTVFIDSTDLVDIKVGEVGVYGGFQKSLAANKVKISGTLRVDKNDNFDPLISPAASVVWTPTEKNFLRFSFSSAIRNPTLTDQYLDFNVGRATLRGHIDEVKDVVTLESFDDFRRDPNLNRSLLDSFNIPGIQPEEVQTFEVGYRTTLFNKIYLDAGYYFSSYTNFIGFNLGADVQFVDATSNLPTSVDIYRYSANSTSTVKTQGLSVGLNYYWNDFKIAGNYSYNDLVVTNDDDPIIPAFNTPKHKYNIGFSGRQLKLTSSTSNTLGYNINYKWIQGYLFEGSPQFTGFIPSYGLVDAQVNYNLKKQNLTIKVGASNILNNLVFQAYGGPRIGRMGYVKLTYDFKSN
ncbi:MAG: iron complex outermembrane receptor protein [Saprospiraceae bacterium]|jgi:iron complex outermembrane receptor protein